MSEYAEFIGGDGIDLDTIEVYNFVTQYFNNPLCKKIKNIASGHAMYCCKIKSFLSKGKKYIFLISDDTGEQVMRMSDIKWKVLQTRTIEDNYDVPLHTYTPQGTSLQIRVFEKGDDMYKYTCSNFKNIIVSLLVGKTQTRMYSDFGELGTAIEVYNTIISF
jgi:hypothetical protein